MKASDLERGEYVHMLLYGPSGGGKTHFIGEWTKAGSVWVNDTDFGIETLSGKEGVDFERWYDRPGEKRPEAWDTLMEFIEDQIEDPIYDTYAFDSLTTLAEVASAKVISKKSPGRDIIQLQDYTSIYSLLTKFITKIRRLKANVILTAHEDVTRDDRGRRIVQPLVLGNKFAPRLPIHFNNVYHLGVEPPSAEGEEPYRSLRVQSDGTYEAKSMGKQSEVMIEPTYEALIEHLTSRE